MHFPIAINMNESVLLEKAALFSTIIYLIPSCCSIVFGICYAAVLVSYCCGNKLPQAE